MAQSLQLELPDIYITANIPMIIQASVLLAFDASAPLPSHHQRRLFPQRFVQFAFFLVLVTPIMNTYFLKTIPQSTTQLEVLNRIRGLVLFTTLSLMSVIVISYDKLNILFKFDSMTAKIIHGIVAFTTVLFQIINLSLISFTDGLPHFDYVFFPIHCVELFCTLLSVELLFIYGLWRHASTQAVRRRSIGYNTARLFGIMAIGIAGNIACHIGLLTANSLEGIATWVPRSVMLSTTNSVLTINALLLLKLWNRRSPGSRGPTSKNTPSHNTNAYSEKAVPASPTMPAMPHLSMIGKNKYGGSFIDTQTSSQKKHSETCISPISASGTATGTGTCTEQRVPTINARAHAHARPSSTATPCDPHSTPTIPPRYVGSPSASCKASMISSSEAQLITRIPSSSLIKLPISPPYPFPHRNEYDHEFGPEPVQVQQHQ